MNKLAFIGVLAFTLSAIAGAQTKPTQKPKTTIKCAVMTDDVVNIAKATKDKMFADYKGKRYFFCCKACLPAFKKNPAKYAKNESLPTPKPIKK